MAKEQARAIVEIVAGDGACPRDWWYLPRWVPRVATTAHGVPGGQWLVFADADLGDELGRALDGGLRVYPLGILDGDLDAQWVAELGGVQRVLFAPAVTGTAIDVVSAIAT